MKTGMLSIIGLIALLWLLLNIWFYLQQPKMVFYPTRDLTAAPDDWGLVHEEVNVSSADGVVLHGWYLPHAKAIGTLLFLHGNGGNISHRGESLRIFHRLGLNVLIIDYRGYGLSGGEPSEEGLYRDARSAWYYLTTERGIRSEEIVIFGRSLGGTVASRLASEVQPAGLIVESSFSSVADMAREVFPLLSNVVALRYRFDAAGVIAKVRAPVFLLHSPEDEVVPYALGQKLFRSVEAPKWFHQLTGDHNSGFLQSQPEYEVGLQRYLREQVFPAAGSQAAQTGTDEL